MAIALRSPNGTANMPSTGSAATTWTGTLPSGVVAGDVMICVVHVNAATGTVAVSNPAGAWSTYAGPTGTGGTNGSRSAWFYRIATGSDAGQTLTVTVGAAQLGGAVVAAFSGVDQVTPLDVAAPTATTSGATATTSPTTPAITPVTNGAGVIMMPGSRVGANATSGGVFTQPGTPAASLAISGNRSGTNGNTYDAQAIAYYIQPTAALVSAQTWTQTISSWYSGQTMALRPAAETATPKRPIVVSQAVHRSYTF